MKRTILVPEEAVLSPIEYIIQQTAKSFSVDRKDLRRDVRIPLFVRARFAAMCIAVDLLDPGLMAIARAFERNHATVINGISRGRLFMAQDKGYARKVKLLTIRLRTDLALANRVRAEALELMLQGERELSVIPRAAIHRKDGINPDLAAFQQPQNGACSSVAGAGTPSA